jgi:Asp/Glu/hydantoin racemase
MMPWWAMGLSHFYAGSEATGLGVLELETKPREEVLGRMGDASRRLVGEKGADCVLLGCAGMTDMVRSL